MIDNRPGSYKDWVERLTTSGQNTNWYKVEHDNRSVYYDVDTVIRVRIRPRCRRSNRYKIDNVDNL